MLSTSRFSRRHVAALLLVLPFTVAGCSGGAGSDSLLNALGSVGDAASHGTGKARISCTVNGEEAAARISIVTVSPVAATLTANKDKDTITVISNVPAGGDASVEVTVDGYGSKTLRLAITKDQTTNFNFAFGTTPAPSGGTTPSAGLGTLRVRVKDTSGNSIAAPFDILVNNAVIGSSTTASDGWITATNIPAGDVTIRVTASGLGTITKTQTVPANGSIDFDLSFASPDSGGGSGASPWQSLPTVATGDANWISIGQNVSVKRTQMYAKWGNAGNALWTWSVRNDNAKSAYIDFDYDTTLADGTDKTGHESTLLYISPGETWGGGLTYSAECVQIHAFRVTKVLLK